MKSSPEAAPAEKYLGEMLDALEAGLLRLRRARDDLRETLERAARQSARQPRNPRRSPAPKPRPEKDRSLQPSTPNEAEPQSQPKAPRKTRNALGRTLTQMRVPREPGHSG
jgi:hypothetical protein